MIKRWTSILIGLIFVTLILAFTGCSGSKTASTENSTKEPLTNEKWTEVNTNPDSFKGDPVDIIGKIFIAPEKDKNGTYFQMYTDPKNSEFNTIVAINDPNSNIKDGDYVHVIGKIKGKFSGENAFGAKLTAAAVNAEKVEKVDAKEILAPTKLKVDVNQSKEQHGLVITLKRIELANEETRLYVTIKNNSQQKASFYSFNTKAIQGSNQFEEQDNWEANYPKISSDILSGVESSGVVTLKPLDVNTKSAKIFLEAGTDNYMLDFSPYVFDVVF